MTAFDLPSMRSRELDVVVRVEVEEELLEDEELLLLDELSSPERLGLSSEEVELEELDEELLDELESSAEPDELDEHHEEPCRSGREQKPRRPAPLFHRDALPLSAVDRSAEEFAVLRLLSLVEDLLEQG